MSFAALVATDPARAGGPPYPAVPPEVGVAPFIGPSWDTYRCAEGPVINFYHGAYYGEEPPALYRGYRTGRITATAPTAGCRANISAFLTNVAAPTRSGGKWR
ncbi:hypothetical protein [Bradyrhizobium sp. RT5a]|uniref:hypothetical protein n=1 Tax=Bradyrhizobium sp. RT5a TaxID=3156380 RepID=UPI003391A926